MGLQESGVHSSVYSRRGNGSSGAVYAHVGVLVVVGPESTGLAQALQQVFLVPKVKLLSNNGDQAHLGWTGRSSGGAATSGSRGATSMLRRPCRIWARIRPQACRTCLGPSSR